MSVSRLKNESGYSLAEVVVAIMLLSIAIIPMVSMFDAGLRAAVLGGNYDRGRAIAGEELEEIKALPFRIDPNPPIDSAVELFRPANGPLPPPGGSTPCSDPIEDGFVCSVRTTYLNPSTLSPDSGARTMMQVEVTVRWDGNDPNCGGSTKCYTTTGLASKETR